MTTSRDVTPANFRCGENSPCCPSVHVPESGDYIYIGNYVSKGELTNMAIPKEKMPSDGESAVRFSAAFMDAFFMEYGARKLAELNK